MKKILLGIVTIILFLGIVYTLTGQITHNRIQKRVAYWESLIDKEIPTGTRKENVEQWGQQQHLKLEWIPSKNMLDANVEQLPDAGIGFPCSSWNIIVDIYIGNDGSSLRRKVHSIGNCI